MALGFGVASSWSDGSHGASLSQTPRGKKLRIGVPSHVPQKRPRGEPLRHHQSKTTTDKWCTFEFVDSAFPPAVGRLRRPLPRFILSRGSNSPGLGACPYTTPHQGLKRLFSSDLLHLCSYAVDSLHLSQSLVWLSLLLLIGALGRLNGTNRSDYTRNWP